MKLSFLILLAAQALSASFGERYDGDFEFLEQKFSLKSDNNVRGLRSYERSLLTNTLEWPECKGMNVWDCKAYIENYIASYGGHIIKNMELVVRQPREVPVFDDSYYFNGVRSNFEVIGQSACDRFNGTTVHRNRDNGSWSWFYSNGTNYTVPDLDCFNKTNAECCDIIWEHGDWMGLDKDGRHLTCYVYQEPIYPFLDARKALKYPDSYNDAQGLCKRKIYSNATLQLQYQKVADKIKNEVILQIDNYLAPTALTGYCTNSKGADQNTGVRIIKRADYGPSDALLQDCLKLCQQFQINKTIEVTGCEAVWGMTTRGCYAHTAEVKGASGKISNNTCFVDPIRPANNQASCKALKSLVDNMYNYARMTYTNGLVGRIQFEYLSKYCANGEEQLTLNTGLRNLLTALKTRFVFNGVVELVHFVYIVGDINGIVVSVPRVATNNPALNPILWNSADMAA